jgi:hypothetical protein
MVNGALANVDNNEDDQKFTYNLYTTESTDPTKEFDFGSFSLQDYYGSAIMPSLNWVTKVKTGEVVYDPTDEEQNKLLQDYEAFVEANGQIEGLPTPGEIIANEVGPILGQVAEGVGSSLMTGGTFAEGLPFTKSGMDFAEGVTSFSPKALKALDATTFENLTEAGMAGGEIATEKAATVLGGEDKIGKFGGTVGRNVMEAPGVTITDRLNIFDEAGSAGAQNLRSAAGGAVGNFAVQLALGRDPVKAAKSAGAGAIGKIIGNAILPGIGGFIGGALGSIVGGRVICNELMRQGLLTRKQVIMDYRFTRDYLTPTHVNGYHLWAVWMVKQMRKGKFVKFWKHVAGHRANEIAYIYGERQKPDYLGKVYRKILEPTCWVIGKFCKITDWSVLYKQKEI